MANLAEVISNLTTGQLSAAIAVLVLISAIFIRQKYHLNYPDNLPRVGEPPGKTSFSLKTRLAYYNDSERVFHEAYHTVNKYIPFPLRIIINAISTLRMAKHAWWPV